MTLNEVTERLSGSGNGVGDYHHGGEGLGGGAGSGSEVGSGCVDGSGGGGPGLWIEDGRSDEDEYPDGSGDGCGGRPEGQFETAGGGGGGRARRGWWEWWGDPC